MHIIHINSDFSFSGLLHYLFPYKKHEKSQSGCQNNRMFEQILLLKIDSKFHGFFLFTLMIPMLIQWLGVQMFEEDRRKDIKEGKNLNGGIL